MHYHKKSLKYKILIKNAKNMYNKQICLHMQYQGMALVIVVSSIFTLVGWAWSEGYSFDIEKGTETCDATCRWVKTIFRY